MSVGKSLLGFLRAGQWSGDAPTAHPSKESAIQVEQELLEAYANDGPVVPVAVLLSAGLIASMAWDRAPRALSVGWLLAVVVVLLIRHLFHQRFMVTERASLNARLAWSTAISALGGVTHGASILFWPYLDQMERALQSTYVLALGSGAVAAVIGYMPMFLAYALPLLLPMIWSWVQAAAQTPGPQTDTVRAAVVLLMFMIYLGFLAVLARDTFQRYVDSFESRRRLRDALLRAEAANRSKTRFLASASHDLRQPMHTLTLFTAALGMAPLDPRARQIADQMRQAVQVLGSQLDALLDVSKLDAGVVTVREQVLALRPYLAGLLAQYQPQTHSKGLTLALDCPYDVDVLADPMLLERVLRNLIDNAVKYTPNGHISVHVEMRENQVQMTVRDTGTGIPIDEQQRVFEEFYQLGNAERNRSLGLGLGLSIVRRLSELLQLGVELKSTPGVGTEVTFALRRSKTVPPAPERRAEHKGPADVAGLHVLVVDDEESVRLGMETVLEGLGCQALTVGDSAAAELALSTRPFDIVVADLRLRGTESGIDLVQRLRRLRPGIPALLISGDTAPDRLREASRAGLRLLHKPVTVEPLTQAMREEVDARTGTA